MLRLAPYTKPFNSLHLTSVFVSEEESHCLWKVVEANQVATGTEFYRDVKYVFTVLNPETNLKQEVTLTQNFDFTYCGTYDPQAVTADSYHAFMRALSHFRGRVVFQAGCYFRAKFHASAATQYELYIFTANMVLDKRECIDVIASPSRIIGKGRSGETTLLAGRIEPEFGLFGRPMFKAVEQLVKLQVRHNLGAPKCLTGARFSELQNNEDQTSKKISGLKYKKTRLFGGQPYYVEMNFTEVATPIVKTAHSYSKMKYIKGWTLKELYVDPPVRDAAVPCSAMEDTKQFLLSPAGRYVVIFGLLQAKMKLEELGIVHGDIKADNVIAEYVPAARYVRIWFIDFGHSFDVSIPANAMKKSLIGAPLFAAPEVLSTSKSSFVSDMFSIGLLIAEIMGDKSLRRKYSRSSAADFYPMRIGGYAIDVECFECDELKDLPQQVKQSIMSIINECLKFEAKDRIIASRAYEAFQFSFAVFCSSLATYYSEQEDISYNLDLAKSTINHMKLMSPATDLATHMMKLKNDFDQLCMRVKSSPIAWRAYCQALGVVHLANSATPELFAATCRYYFTVYDKHSSRLFTLINAVTALYRDHQFKKETQNEFDDLWRKINKFLQKLLSARPTFDDMVEQSGDMLEMIDILVGAVRHFSSQAIVDHYNKSGLSYVSY